MKIIDRIFIFITSQKIKVSAFEKKSGLSNGYIKKIIDSPSAEKLEYILNAYPQLNRDWLFTGEGEMLNRSDAPTMASEPHAEYTSLTDRIKRFNDIEQAASDIYKSNFVPLMPISAQGGSLNDFAESVKYTECEKIYSPINGVDFAMRVTGDSMAPDYPAGAHILIKKINEYAFIEWGKVYVLDTCNGSVLKEVRKGDNPNEVICTSINSDPKYAPFPVKLSDVYGIYRVLLCMSLK